MMLVRTEPTRDEVHAQQERRPSAVDAMRTKHALKVDNREVTGASQITTRQSLLPVALVTILFFLWGFAYGLLDILNRHFQEVLDISKTMASGLQAAYFGAYFLGPLTYAGWVLRRFGYKWTFVLGLVLYGVGSLMFWPSGIKRSFGGFCGSMFIVGSGLSTLETAANPFIAVCGPPKYSEMRLNLAQAVQAVGTVAAPLLGARVIFKDINDADSKSLESVQWVYLGIAIFVFLLAVVFVFSPIPEVTDSDMADQAEQSREYNTEWEDRPLRKQYTLFWGVMAQFTYVGAQVAIAGYFINYILEVRPGTSSSTGSNLLAVAQGLFAIGRFAGGFSMKFIKPRLVFLGFMTGCVVFISVAMGVKGDGGIAALSLVLFFESIIFPTIFAVSLRGLGRHTKRGATFLVAAVAGGAVWPPMTAAVADRSGTPLGMGIPLMGFLLAWSFPIYVNLTQAKQLDGFFESKIGIKNQLESTEGKLEEGDAANARELEDIVKDKEVEAGKLS